MRNSSWGAIEICTIHVFLKLNPKLGRALNQSSSKSITLVFKKYEIDVICGKLILLLNSDEKIEVIQAR